MSRQLHRADAYVPSSDVVGDHFPSHGVQRGGKLLPASLMIVLKPGIEHIPHMAVDVGVTAYIV